MYLNERLNLGQRATGLSLALATGLSLVACSQVSDKVAQVKVGMKSDQVQAILGQPTRIEQSETADQNLSGEVDHYAASNGEGRVVLVNHTVFKAEFVPGAKS